MVAEEEVIGICKHLQSVDALTDEHVLDVLLVLTGLAVCGNARFKNMFAPFEEQRRAIGHLKISVSTISPDASPLHKIEAMYDSQSFAGTWLPNTSKGGRVPIV